VARDPGPHEGSTSRRRWPWRVAGAGIVIFCIVGLGLGIARFAPPVIAAFRFVGATTTDGGEGSGEIRFEAFSNLALLVEFGITPEQFDAVGPGTPHEQVVTTLAKEPLGARTLVANQMLTVEELRWDCIYFVRMDTWELASANVPLDTYQFCFTDDLLTTKQAN